jgi:hypothetical protein
MRPMSRLEAVAVIPNELPLEPLLGTSVRIHPFRFDPTLPVDVRLVRWPMEQDYRRDLESVGAPRVLLVERGAPPPPRWDDLEDWVRVPVDQSELELRATTVARRADARERPMLDDDGLLWMRDQWCAVTNGQIPLVRLLVDHFGVVVRDEQVDEVFVDAGTSAHEEAIKTTVRRVSQTLGRLGLRLQRVRGAGYLLEKMV